MYIFEKKVLYSETDEKGFMKYSAMINAMEDVINMHSDSVSRGIDYIIKSKRAWFLISWRIKLYRRPKALETVRVCTNPYRYTKAYTNRNVWIEDMDGNMLLSADSMWSLVDMNTMSLTKITNEDLSGYEIEDIKPVLIAERKLKISEDLVYQESIKVRKDFIDYNGHVNNGVYLLLAAECLEDNEEIDELEIIYKNQTKYNETFDISTHREGNILDISMDAGSTNRAIARIIVRE